MVFVSVLGEVSLLLVFFLSLTRAAQFKKKVTVFKGEYDS